MIIACFGEAKKGKMATPYYIKNTDHLYENLGEPIKDTQGLDFAIKTLYSTELSAEEASFKWNSEVLTAQPRVRGDFPLKSSL